MSSKPQEIAIRVSHLSKCYQIYDKPHDRLKQFVVPRIQRLLGQPPKQYFREFWALKDISFEIKKGETVGIIGRNGSGKSTLLQMICGTLNPTAGEIEVNGRVAALLELGSGFNPEFTGRENVYLNAGVLGLTREQTTARFAEIEAFADIGQFIDQAVKTYSSGMMVRLAFAVIAHVDADILVVDEALAVGDVFFQQKCMRFLESFQERKGAILFVSHDTSAVTSLCSRAIFLTKASDVCLIVGTTDEVCKMYLNDLYANRSIQQVNSGSNNKKEVILNDNHAHQKYEKFIADKQQNNIICLSPFRKDTESFGLGGAVINNVWFEDINNNPVSEIQGGSQVVLCISAESKSKIQSPAVGFMFKDRLGQYIFTEGTDVPFRKHYLMLNEHDKICVRFKFIMPILIQGEYMLNVALAEGQGDNHVQHHWIHDALVLHSVQSRLVHGIAGVHELDITIEVCNTVNS